MSAPANVVDLPAKDAHIPAIRKVGMGYRGVWHKLGVVATLRRLRYDRGDPSGLLEIVSGSEIVHGPERLNLAASTTRSRLAAELAKRTEYSGWEQILDTFCRHVLRLEEQGQPAEWLHEWTGSTAEQFLLDPFLPLGKPTILYGPGGSMKSTLATGCALAVATGHPLLGWTPRVGRVAVLDWETDSDDWNQRATEMCRGLGLTFPTKMISYRAAHTTLPRMVEGVAGWVADIEAALLIVDSVMHASGTTHEGGDAAETATNLFAALRLIGTTTLLVDHVRGEDAEDGRESSRPYGSVVKENSARSTWELRAGHCFGTETQLQLRQDKVNRGRKGLRIGMRAVHDEGSIRLEQCELTDPQFTKNQPLAEQMRRLLSNGSLPTSEIAEALETTSARIRKELSEHKDWFVRFDGGVGREGSVGLRAQGAL